MKMSDYKNYLDKIKCSPEFRAETEKMLSEEIEAEYADSVSSLEPARSRSPFRWTAVTASVLLLFMVGGIALKALSTSVPQHSTDIVSDDSEGVPDLARMIENDTNANEAVMNLFEENIGEQYANSVSYIEGGGQFDDSIEFYEVDISELKSAVESLVWTECDREDVGAGHYSVDGIDFDDNGCMYKFGTGVYYMPVSGQDLSALQQALHNIRFSDPFNRLRNILTFDDLGSNTIEEEISFFHAENPDIYLYGDDVFESSNVVGGEGKLYLDRINGIEYYELEDKFGGLSEFYKNGRFWTYKENDNADYENTDSEFVESEDIRYSTGFYGMGFSPADFDAMRDCLSYVAEAAYCFEKHSDIYYAYDYIDKTEYTISEVDGEIECDISIIFMNGSELTSTIQIDSENNITYATILYYRDYNDKDKGALPVYYFLCHDESARKLNSEDFEIPEPSDELLEVHNELLREEGILE